MGTYINRKTVIDAETGEIMKENNWYGYDGFNEKGYKYRHRGVFVRYYFDAIPSNLSEPAFLLLIMISELMNEENMLVYRVERKSKFSSILYKPLEKEDIREMAIHAEKEANPLYPVPALFTRKEIEAFYYQIADWSK